ncbi:ankyrin repeat-containing domain protein, partial [Rhypophila decipiens]
MSKVLDPHSVDPDASIYMGRTALSLAARSGEIEVLRHLLASDKVDPTSTDNIGRTPLHWAAREGQLEVVKALLAVYNARKLDWELADSDGYTPLDEA